MCPAKVCRSSNPQRNARPSLACNMLCSLLGLMIVRCIQTSPTSIASARVCWLTALLLPGLVPRRAVQHRLVPTAALCGLQWVASEQQSLRTELQGLEPKFLRNGKCPPEVQALEFSPRTSSYRTKEPHDRGPRPDQASSEDSLILHRAKTYLLADIPTYSPAYLLAYLPAYVPICLLAYLREPTFLGDVKYRIPV